MSFFTFAKYGRTLLSAAAAVGAVFALGCDYGDDSKEGAVALKRDNVSFIFHGEQKYWTVRIGGRTWMAENLNYEKPEWVYRYNTDKNDPDTCEKYGGIFRTTDNKCGYALIPDSAKIVRDSCIKSGGRFDQVDSLCHYTVLDICTKHGGEFGSDSLCRYKTSSVDSSRVDTSWCYDNDTGNCKKYGRLYTWATAKKSCPAGYRLPSRGEWNDLVREMGKVEQIGGVDVKSEAGAGTRLKARNGWMGDGNGTDSLEFSALPGGGYDGKSFRGVGYDGYWWTSTPANADSSGFYYRYLYCTDEDSYQDVIGRSYGLSVRCVSDN